MNLMRPLNTSFSATEFVKDILEITNPSEVSDAAGKVLSSELQLGPTQSCPTLLFKDFRDYRYATDESRVQLRDQIFTELISAKRLPDDDDITLGCGGALPSDGVVKAEKQAFVIIGLPASGKSFVASKIADHYGAVIIDSDFAKRKFPEFKQDFGASLVHEEAAMVVFGDDKHKERNMFEACLYKKYNVVIPKIGHSQAGVLALAHKLQGEGYAVHLVLVSLDRIKATQRAYKRYLKSGRYVPLALIFDFYGNNPILTYYRVRDDSCWTTYTVISSDVPQNAPYSVIHEKGNGPAHLFK